MRRNLVIQTAFLGDLLLGIPLFRRLRHNTADGAKQHLTILCRKGLGAMLRELDVCDEVVEVQKGNGESYRLALRKLRAEEPFDQVFCVHESLRSQWLARRIPCRIRIGYSTPLKNLFLNRTLRKRRELPEALRQLALLSESVDDYSEVLSCVEEFSAQQKLPGGRWGYNELIPVPRALSMALPALASYRNSRQDVRASSLREHWNIHRPFIVLAPGSRWATKRWRLNGFAEVGNAYRRLGYHVVIIGGAEERDEATALSKSVRDALSLAGETSPVESASVIAQSELLVSNDSGAMHLAALSSTPTVAIFGPTILDFGYRPWNPRAVIVQPKEGALDCRPCGLHGHQQCPVGTHACMRDISTDHVMAAGRAAQRLDPG